MCEDNIEIGVTEITNNILVSATPTDQIIDINVTEQNEDVTLNITPSVVEVNIDVTQHLVTEQVTVDANTCVNIIDVSVTDATENVTLNITPSIVEVNINRGGGSGYGVWGSITGTLSDQTDLQAALNAKQNALGYTPVPNTRTLTINGVTYDLSANRSWTVAGGLSGSGTTNYLSKWTGASALGNSLVYDDGTNVMIGTNASLYKLTVNTATNVNFGVGRTSLFGTNDAVFLNSVNDTYGSIPFTLNASHIGLYIGYSEKLRINSSGNVLIGTTSGVTGGGLLQVNGIINSGEYGLLGGYVGLDTTPTTTPSTAGTLSWNDTDGTADLKLKGGNVTLQIGQEEVVRVVNKTGATLNEADFRAVRIRSVAEGGSQGQRLAVVLAQANNDANSATTIGLVTESISNNQEGFITTFGNVSEIDTTGAKSYGGLETWVDGDMLYLSPTYAGYLTNVKPSAPKHMVIVGYVVYAHAVHGKIFVKVDNGYELDELHNVAITSPTNGQALVYDSANSVWKNSTISAGLSGSGTTNYVAKWSSNSALTNSLLFDNGTKIGLNTITPDLLFHIYYNSLTSTYNDIAHIGSGAGNSLFLGTSGYGFSLNAAANGADWGIRTDWDSGYMNFHFGASEKMRIASNGNVGIGLTYPAYKLDIVGDVNITGSYRVNGVVIGAGTGTVTSVSATVPTGFSISGSPITSSGTLAITFATGYSLPTTASQTNWDTAYSNRITSASSPLSISANVISIAQATTTTSGYLSSTDWNTFNNKQAALGYTPVPQTRTLTINGTAYDLSADRSWTISAGVSGSGTTNYHAKWTSSSSLSASLIYDNATSIAFFNTAGGTGYALEFNNNAAQPRMDIVENGAYTAVVKSYNSAAWFANNSANPVIFGTSGTERMRITSGGVILMGTTSTFSNEKMRVVGSASYWGTAIFENNQNQLDVNHGTINIVNTRTTYAIGNDASIMFSAYNSTMSMQPRASIGMKVSSDLGGELVFNTRNNSGYAERMRIKETGIINFANVPTSAAGLSSGDVYRIGAALMIV